MGQDAFIRLLQMVKLFEGLTRDDITQMAALFQRKPFAAGDMLLEEGDPSPGLNIIGKGKLKVYLPKDPRHQSGERISEITLNQLKAGDWFGEYSALSGMASSSSIQALTSGLLFRCSPKDFHGFLEADHRVGKTVYYNILQQLLQRFRERESEFDCVMLMS